MPCYDFFHRGCCQQHKLESVQEAELSVQDKKRKTASLLLFMTVQGTNSLRLTASGHMFSLHPL